MSTLRCVTWNLEHGAKGLAAVAQVLRALSPAVVFLQEVDRATRRCGGVDQAASLAHELGLTATFAEAFAFDGGSYGLALLTPGPLSEVTTTRLPHPAPRQEDGHGEPRILLSGEWNGIRFACTHLGLTPDERVEQARALLEALHPFEPVILGGDLNEGAQGAAVGLLGSRLSDAFQVAGGAETRTSPSDRPATRIDFVLASARAPEPLRAFVGPAGASDHRPVVVDFAS